MSRHAPPAATDRGLPFWAGAAVGWALIAWGIAGVARNALDTRPADLVRFVAGGIVLHDLLIVPLALLVALVVVRAVPRRMRRWVQAALVVAAPLALFAYPQLRGYGRIPGNPTALPHDYATNLTLVLLALAAALATVAVASAQWSRRRRRSGRLGSVSRHP